MGGMTHNDIINYFGGVEAAKKGLGLRSRQTIYNWKIKGVPIDAQIKAEVATKGALKADLPKAVRTA